MKILKKYWLYKIEIKIYHINPLTKQNHLYFLKKKVGKDFTNHQFLQKRSERKQAGKNWGAGTKK